MNLSQCGGVSVNVGESKLDLRDVANNVQDIESPPSLLNSQGFERSQTPVGMANVTWPDCHTIGDDGDASILGEFDRGECCNLPIRLDVLLLRVLDGTR